MKSASYFRLLAVVACVLLAGPAWSAENDPAPTPSAALAEARPLILRGKLEEALAILRPLARGREVDGDVLFHIGLAAVGASQDPDASEDLRNALLDEAIASFRTMLVADPTLVRVRLELARAFFLKDEDRLAKRHFEQVLAGKPPAPVVLNVNRFLAQIRARRRWDLHAGFAPGAGHQHRRKLGREDHLHQRRRRAAPVHTATPKS